MKCLKLIRWASSGVANVLVFSFSSFFFSSSHFPLSSSKIIPDSNKSFPAYPTDLVFLSVRAVNLATALASLAVYFVS